MTTTTNGIQSLCPSELRYAWTNATTLTCRGVPVSNSLYWWWNQSHSEEHDLLYVGEGDIARGGGLIWNSPVSGQGQFIMLLSHRLLNSSCITIEPCLNRDMALGVCIHDSIESKSALLAYFLSWKWGNVLEQVLKRNSFSHMNEKFNRFESTYVVAFLFLNAPSFSCQKVELHG